MRSARSVVVLCSSISARCLRTSTAARRTVHTLIGSYDAFRTSTRPVEPVLCPGRTVGVLAATAGILAVAHRRNPRIRAEDAHRLDVAGHCLDGLDDRRLGLAAVEVAEEHVVAQANAPRARLDAGEVHLAARELPENADQPARRLVAGAPEHDRGLQRPLVGERCRRVLGSQPYEARPVV